MKKIVAVFILFFTYSSIALCYEEYTPARYIYHPTGTYENLNNRNHNFYQNNYERNKYEPTKYYCYIPNNSDTGYMLEKSPMGTVGYQRQEFMGVREKIKCHRTESHTPVVKSFEEARNYKD